MKKVFLILTILFPISVYAGTSVDDSLFGTRVINASSGIASGVTVSSDLEMGNTPYSIDGGTNGLAFDTNNDGTNEVVFTNAGALVTAAYTDPSVVFDASTVGDTDFWVGGVENEDANDNDYLKVGWGTSAGSNAYITMDYLGKLGIQTTPTAWLHIVPPTPSSVATTPGTAASNSITITGNTGGVTTISTTGIGGVGGGITTTLGTGGAASSAATSSTGGKGGTYSINIGPGAAAAVAGTGTNTGGAGGDFNITGGTGGAATGNTSGVNTGGQGSVFSFIAGTGGAANTGSGNLVGGTGGGFTLRAGTGGIGTTSGGGGGNITVQGGNSAAMAGAAAGGTANLKGGNPSSTGSGGAGGPVAITGTDAGGDNTVNRSGGTITLLAGASKGSSAGAAISITAGSGGVGTAATGATGGAITVTSGAGGAGSTTGGSGGDVNIVAGSGGSSPTPGSGGAIVFKTSTGITPSQRMRIGAGGFVAVGTNAAQTATGIIVDLASTQTVAGGDTITADSCGSIKRVTAGGSVTTSTSNTFTAPAAGNAGCIMYVCNTGTNNITLDNNSNFKSNLGADVVLGQDDCVIIGSTGSSGVWYQMSALELN